MACRTPFPAAPECRQATARSAEGRQVLIDSGFDPDQVQLVCCETAPRELAARHVELYAALTLVTCN